MSRMMGAFNSAYGQQTITFNYTSALVTTKFFIASRPTKVKHIRGIVVTQGSGGACTLQVYKAADTVAIASGKLLHSGTYDLAGTADAAQTMTMATDQNTVTLNEGDSIGFVLTGTATSAVGVIEVVLEPLS